MKTKIKFLSVILGVLNLFLIFGFAPIIYSQNYFARGVFGYDEPFPGHPLNANEQGLILDTHGNFIYGLIDTSLVDDFISFCNSNNLKTCIEKDPTSVPGSGPFYPYPGEPKNIYLDYYICRNTASDIDCTLIRQLITNIHDTYPSEPGLGAILVAHQERTHEADHWPYIQYACSLIHANYGDNVRSLVIDNAGDWTLANLESFFRTVDSLNCFQHEFYPFHVGSQLSYPPTDSTIFNTDAFQINLIDNQLIDSYNLVRQALVNSGNKYTHWELIYQAHREWDRASAHFWRRPTQAELWLQAFLALSRGAKGVHAYVYRTNDVFSLRSFGLVDNGSTRQKINTPVYNRPYDNVAQLNEYLAILGAAILDDTVHTAFTWTGTRYKYLKSITGDSTDGPSPPNTHRTIEVCIFKPRPNNNNYQRFMLINRRCNRDSLVGGVHHWVNAFPQNIDVALADSMPTGTYQIRDLYSNEHYVTSDKIFRQIKILAGRGRVFELKRLFVNATDILSDTVNICSNITVPTGKTLIINPGATVLFTNGTKLTASGNLIANGSSSQHITFRSYGTTPGSWQYIQYSSGSSGSLQYCDILYATKGIWIANVSPTIQHNVIRYFTEQGIYISGASAAPDVQYNTISNGGVQGIYVIHSHPTYLPTLQNNTIGTAGDAMTYGFERYNGTSGLVVSFQNNTIRYTSSSGAAIKVSSATVEIVNNTITNNAGHGIWNKDSGLPDIHDNDINANSKNGIYVEQSSPTNIKWNNIQGNGLSGIVFMSTSSATYFSTLLQNKWNNIYHNTKYELSNLKTTPLMAENQFWNLFTYAEIDYEVNGNVDFNPWKTTANPNAGPGGSLGKELAEAPIPAAPEI
ncbi:MAG: right-handed parallel beta-helix repeat-containing protein [candidate division KSB1 bacterium]|nr:right-handed parallel beta-helix repeat-containing protein [candidate division KSB1 bacterium]